MNKDKQVILVTGATGQQGGATARHLLANGWPVRALTRDLTKPASRALAEAGAEIVQGDFDNLASLERAAVGAYGMFSVQTPQGFEGEVRHGKIVADSAKAAGVQHLVYSSVGGAERKTGIPHFESKWVIEQYIQQLALPATVLRPTYFMNNLNWQRPQILNGTFTAIGMDPDKPLQMIAAGDIGAVAALAFENPSEFLGQAVEIAGDELTEQQIVELLAKVTGRPVRLVPAEGSPAFEDMVTMVTWFNQYGYQADIPALRKRLPALMTFETWLKKNNWENIAPTR